ncbi:hypothetical protein BU14_0262s0013 [Porphyra umbilicalis]|uniref:DUF177 domain-containing protein n=1 Tax=Porphyra umbilicalis TaxID=2786 RepID=A0A1X6P286_PORUM|nr:hypothetical protein BU14_0262s0013 [Porphyra umbilicalis]|eukprot:OSX74896.1 hypothetical protein BU14_0262s0013 [Porphyra umbilicalis]
MAAFVPPLASFAVTGTGGGGCRCAYRHRPSPVCALRPPTPLLGASSFASPFFRPEGMSGAAAATLDCPLVASTADPTFPLARSELSAAGVRSVLLSRPTTLGALGVDGLGPDATAVEVSMRIRRGKGGHLVRGKVATRAKAVCDRCCGSFEADVEGRFEVLLTSREARPGDAPVDLLEEGEMGAADVEEQAFPTGLTSVDLGGHVHDAVCLGVPTKLLCGADCPGVDVSDVDGVTVSKGDATGGRVRIPARGNAWGQQPVVEDDDYLDDEGEPLLAEAMAALKRRMQKRG